MGVSCPEPAVAPAKASSSNVRSSSWLAIVAAASVWLPLLYHLSLEWRVNEQYRYGFLVPVFAGYLMYSRWVDRPQPHPPCSTRGPLFIGCLLLALLFPLVLVEAANPDWRLLSWVWSSAVVGLTGVCICLLGGWTWLRHFLVPLTFIFVAVPWPMAFETGLVQTLLRSNAAAAVEILQWFAIPAMQAGNVITIGDTHVGVEDACSGVRSLQTSLMAGWLLGELHRLLPAFRVLLLVVCAAVALAWNLIRTLVLVLVAHAQGTEAMAGWHDHIGTAALLLALASWILLAHGVGRIARPRCAEEWIVPGAPRRRGLPTGTFVSSPASLSSGACWMVIACAAACHLAVEAWYWPTRAGRERHFDWTVHWPADVHTRELPIAAATRGVLKYSHGTNRVWEDQAGRRWSAFHLQWAPGRTAHAVAQVHRPEICLPAAGRDLLEDRGVRLFEAAGVVLPFRHYVFGDADLPLHVFFSLATRRGTDHRGAPEAHELTRAERLRAVRERRRNEGQQQLEIGLWGARTSQEAERVFAQALETLLVPTPQDG